jgi:hypothetical protein
MKTYPIMAKRGQLIKIEQEFADFVDIHDTSEMIEKGQLKEVKNFKITVSARERQVSK